jgi:hypothetical protein
MWAPLEEEPTPFERRCRIRWARLIRQKPRSDESGAWIGAQMVPNGSILSQ